MAHGEVALVGGVRPWSARAARRVLDRYRCQPVAFLREILAGDPWEVEEMIMAALAKPHARVAVRSCHGSGKTWTAAAAVLWWVATGGLVVTTAARFAQVRLQLWEEVRRAYSRAAYPIGGQLNDTELRMAPGWYAVGLSTNEEVRMHGFHAERLLVVMDEAPGIAPRIWQALEGARAGGDVRHLVLGNPISSAHDEYRACFAADRSRWTTLRIDAFDTPNLRGVGLAAAGVAVPDGGLDLLDMGEAELDTVERRYLVTRRWVREVFERYGTDSPYWQARVRGEFPTQSEFDLVQLAWAEAARARDARDGGGPVVVGVDVAGPGDDETAVCARSGSTILASAAWRADDARGVVVGFLRDGRWAGRLERVAVDEVGIGYHVVTHLRDLGFPVVGVNVGAAARDPDRFVNLKAEMAWAVRERFAAGDLSGLEDEETIGQLCSIRWDEDPRGRTRIETKDAARRRGVRSPDRADALILAFAGGSVSVAGAAGAGFTRLAPLAPLGPRRRVWRAAGG